MTIDYARAPAPTRKDWLAARERLERLERDWQEANPDQTVDGPPVVDAVEAILGPRPPEPVPEPFRLDAYTLVRIASPYLDKIAVPRHLLTPDEAFAMSEALYKHAVYAREQEASGLGASPLRDPWPVGAIEEPSTCGEKASLRGTPCVRPENHPGVCAPYRLERDDG